MDDGFEITQTVSDKLADERPYVEMHLIVCRECDFSTSVPDPDEGSVYATHDAHATDSGHTRFWKYTIGRSRGRIEPLRRPRR